MTYTILETSFKNYRFNSIHHTGDVRVSWFKLIKDEEHNERGQLFTKEEYDLFESYTLHNTENFPVGQKEYHFSEDPDEGVPYSDVYGDVPVDGRNHPSNIILRKSPNKRGKEIHKCMDVILTSGQGMDNHKYDLPFDVIGKVHLT